MLHRYAVNFAPQVNLNFNLGGIKKPIILVDVDNKQYDALIDTGSSVSLINESNVPVHSSITRTEQQISDINGQLKNCGYTVFNIQFSDSISISEKFIVLDDKHKLPTKLLLGTSLLNNIGAKVDFSNKMMRGEVKQVKFSIPIYSNNLSRTFYIHSDSDIVIPANSQKIVLGKSRCDEGEYIVCKNDTVPNVFIAESVGIVDDKGRMPLLILNPFPHNIMLNNNQKLAEIQPLEQESLNDEVFFCDEETASKEKSNLVVPPVESKDLLSLVEHKHMDKMKNILNEFRDIVALPGEKLGVTKLIKANITTGDHPPIYKKQYPLPHKTKKELNVIVDDMLAGEIIRPSVSPWNSPMILVKKKDNTFRPCVDFRKLNEVTKADKFPLPKINELLHSLHGAKYFSSLDLESSYWQTEIDEKDKEKTAFSTENGHFEFNRLPFGLKNAPSIFSRLMQIALAGLIGVSVFVYIDDIIVFSNNEEEHMEKLKQVFQKLREANLKIKLKKCTFFKSSIKFLGHKVDKNGISIHEDHLEPIKNYPVPKCKKDIQKLMGFLSFFRSYVPNFAEIALPITELLKNDARFEWNSVRQDALDKLKNLLTCPPILLYPNFNEKFYLFTDASASALGAVLMQKDTGNDKLKPIAYISRALSKTEGRYSVSKKEALAIVYALKSFRHLVLGYKIEVFSDHQPLRVLFQKKLPEGQLGRWALLLQEFDITVNYIKGKANVLADSLSRIYNNVVETEQDCVDEISDFVAATNWVEGWTDSELQQLQIDDVKVGSIIRQLQSGKKISDGDKVLRNYVLVNGILMYRKVITKCDIRKVVLTTVIPEALEAKAISIAHESAWAGHMGIDRTFIAANQCYSFNNMKSKITKFIQNCHACKAANAVRHKPVPARKYPLPEKPFAVLALDLLGPLKVTQSGNKYIIVITDFLTRYSWMQALPDRSTYSITNALKIFVNLYDTPRILLSDNAAELTSEILRDLCKSYGIRKLEVAPYHPASNGVVERVNSKILRMLRVYCNETSNQSDWDEFLLEINSAINTSFHQTLGDSPFFILYNFDKGPAFKSIETEAEDPFYQYDDYFRYAQHKRQLVEKYFRDRMETEMNKYLSNFNKGAKERSLELGQRVYMKHVPKPTESRKLAQKWSGPHVVVAKASKTKYVLENPRLKKKYIVHIDNIISRGAIVRTTSSQEVEPTIAPVPETARGHAMKLRNRAP